MTNEQEKAKELAKLLTAFTDRKQLEFAYKDGWSEYRPCSLYRILTDFQSGDLVIRIKPATRRVEYNFDDNLIGKIVIEKHKFSVVKRMIISQDKISVLISDYQSYTDKTWYGYNQLAELFTWSDNSPCYKEVECE